MTALYKDRNYNVTPNRLGDPVGGLINIDVSEITANTWYRLCPSGSAGAKVTGNRNQLNIGALRADVQNTRFYGWKLKILNPTHEVMTLDVMGHYQRRPMHD